MKGRKRGTDGLEGVGLVIDLGKYLKIEYLLGSLQEGHMSKWSMTKLKPMPWSTSLKIQTVESNIRSTKQLMDAAVAKDVRNITNATSRVEASWVNLLKKEDFAYLEQSILK